MKNLSRTVSNLNELALLAQDFAKEILASDEKKISILFHAAMAAGKTTFVRLLGQALGINHPIQSPSFIGVNEYHNIDTGLDFYHFDLYQVKANIEELAELLNNNDNQRKIFIFEWAENINSELMTILSKTSKIIKINIQVKETEERLINFENIK